MDRKLITENGVVRTLSSRFAKTDKFKEHMDDIAELMRIQSAKKVRDDGAC